MQIRSYKLPPLPGKKNAPIQIQLKSEKMIIREANYPTSIRRPNSSSKERPTSGLKRTGSARSISSRDSIDSTNSRAQSKQKINALYNLKTRISMPNVTAKSWAVYQMKSQKYIYGKRTLKRKQIASLTKIMNLITILELLQSYELNPSKIKVRISKQASYVIGTTAQIKHDMQFYLEDLFYGMMLPSGNDAAYQIAQIGGSLAIMFRERGSIDKSIAYDCQKLTQFYKSKNNSVIVYLQQMNRVAKKIGMINSSFANPHGLSNTENYSAADDVCKLCIYSMKDPKFRQIVNTQSYSCQYSYYQDQTDKQNCTNNRIQKDIKVWENTNKMLKEGWNGVKTGITPNAGPCLAASKKQMIKNKEYQFLVVLINSKSMQARWKQVRQIVNWVVNEGLY